MTHEPVDEVELLRAFVQGRDVACPACGYNLRNASSSRCAECGAALNLNVGPATQRLGLWWVPVLATALPLGFCLTVLAIGVNGLCQFGVGGQRYALGEQDVHVLAMYGVASACYAGLLFALASLRRRFTAARRVTRWLLALLSLAVLIPSFVVLLRTSLWTLGYG